MDEDYNLWVLLHQTTDAVAKARQKELNQYSISVIEVGVLVVIQAIGERATPKVISEALGHASVAFTMDTYSHIIEGMQEEAMALLDGVSPEGVSKNSVVELS